MKKGIQVLLMEDAEEFLANKDMAVRKKFGIAFNKTQSGYKGEWFKALKDTDELYEFRVENKNIAYRLLAFWDKSKKEKTLLISTHGFIKKKQRTPKKEIKRATDLKKTYFNS